MWCWILLAVLRISLTVLPQKGYIHPDEFFQSPEVVAGDIFDIATLRTWEFSSSFPVRTIVFPYLSAGLPFLLLRELSKMDIFSSYFQLNTYLLIVIPRFTMALLSFICDWSLYRICKILGTSPKHHLVLFASSYVTLVFYTRTFSNSFEAILFSMLLYMVIKSLKTSNRVGSQDNGFWISIIITAGFFNRPTFLFFAIVPFLFWLFRNNKQSFGQIALKLLSLMPGSLITAIFFVLADSFYYCGFTLETIMKTPWDDLLASLDSSKLIITPLNFIIYNTNPQNLASHGSHPFYLHLLVNVPMLFGIFGLLGLIVCFFFLKKEYLLSSSSYYLLASFSFLIPVLLLSAFSHQEPRFLIPLLIPLILIYSFTIFKQNLLKTFVFYVWIMFNIIGFLIFGILHQGGITSCIGYLQTYTQLSSIPNITRVVFYHTYMPPRHLFFSKHEHKHEKSSTPLGFAALGSHLVVHDMAGSSEEMLFNGIKSVMERPDFANSELLIVSPASLHHKFCVDNDKFTIKLVKSFPLHLSTEDLPDIASILQCTGVNLKMCRQTCLSTMQQLWNEFSLNLYNVTFISRIETSNT